MNTQTGFRKAQPRSSFVSDTVLPFFSNWASRPRLLLEVFVRKNFGRNYFNMGSVFSVLWRVVVFPIVVYYGPKLWKFLFGHETYEDAIIRTYKASSKNYWLYELERRKEAHKVTFNTEFWGTYGTWYILALAFLVFAIIRWSETRSGKNNSHHQSTYMGDIHPLFFKLDFLGKANERNIAILYEPMLFIIVGFILTKFGQNVGWLIIVSAIFYSLGNYADYRFADGVLTTTTDQIKNNEAIKRYFEDTDNNPNRVSTNGTAQDGADDRWIGPEQDDDKPTFAH
jgi:hypothetical protein